MGWTDILTDMVKGLRATGKKEKEIKEIITTAADKATVNQLVQQMQERVINACGIPATLATSAEGRTACERQMAAVTETARKAGTNARDALDAMSYAVNAMRAATPIKIYFSRESNNWRKMHGLPMRRKGGKRHGRTGSSHRH